MMRSIKIIVRKYETKEGKKFTKATAKGKYLPLALVEDEVNYTIKFVGEVKMPTEEGLYEVAFEDGGIWVDSRPDYVSLNIVRVRATKVVFNKYLPKLDKDIRA